MVPMTPMSRTSSSSAWSGCWTASARWCAPGPGRARRGSAQVDLDAAAERRVVQLGPDRLHLLGEVVDQRPLDALARVELQVDEPRGAVVGPGRRPVDAVAPAGGVQQVLVAGLEAAALRAGVDYFDREQAELPSGGPPS